MIGLKLLSELQTAGGYIDSLLRKGIVIDTNAESQVTLLASRACCTGGWSGNSTLSEGVRGPI